MSKVKLMIELSQEEYEFLKDLKWVNIGRGSCKTIQKNVINAIKFGTPIPEGDAISRSELQKRREADKPCEWVEKQFEYEDETSEETRTDTILVCPKCGKQKQPFGRVNFCYWCGARFVKESEREKTMAEDLHDFLMND